MAIFSNLEGTMSKSFVIGKKGTRLVYSSSDEDLKVFNHNMDALIPVGAADPEENHHLVTLNYFNEHNFAGQDGQVLSGLDIPTSVDGYNGNLYIRYNNEQIANIYIKVNNEWRPLYPESVTDSDYVTYVTVSPSDFVLSGNIYVYEIIQNVHNRGSNLILQLQQDGEEIWATTYTDANGDIYLEVSSLPTSDINVVIIGDTELATPYTTQFSTTDWISSGTEYTYTLLQTSHQQEGDTLFFSVYELNGVRYYITTIQSSVSTEGNITLTSNTPINGKIVVSGI